MVFHNELGLVGFGVMGEALSGLLVGKGILCPGEIIACDPEPSRDDLARATGLVTVSEPGTLAARARTIALCVKPQNILPVLEEIGPVVSDSQLIVSIVAGVPTTQIESKMVRPVPVIRTMPNLPCIVGEGMMAFSPGTYADTCHIETARKLLGGFGHLVEVDEDMMDAVTGLSGSGPAFLALILEALTDAGIQLGFPHQISLQMAAQTMLGTATMVLKKSIRPSDLRNMVASPGGTAITGLYCLERSSVRGALIEAVMQAAERSTTLGKKGLQSKTTRISAGIKRQ